MRLLVKRIKGKRYLYFTGKNANLFLGNLETMQFKEENVRKVFDILFLYMKEAEFLEKELLFSLNRDLQLKFLKNLPKDRAENLKRAIDVTEIEKLGRDYKKLFEETLAETGLENKEPNMWNDKELAVFEYELAKRYPKDRSLPPNYEALSEYLRSAHKIAEPHQDTNMRSLFQVKYREIQKDKASGKVSKESEDLSLQTQQYRKFWKNLERRVIEAENSSLADGLKDLIEILIREPQREPREEQSHSDEL